MAKNNTNYANEKPDRRRAAVLIITILALLAIMLVGTLVAYYSDIFERNGDVTSSTLKINGTYTVYLNETETTLDDINSLNPGDVIRVSGTITNTGNQSAWVRERLAITSNNAAFLADLEFYNTLLTQTSFAPGYDHSEFLLDIDEDGVAVSPNRVINGTGEGAQIEDESSGAYNYINSNTYNFNLTIYFKHTSTNATQGQTFNLSVATQALQFKNNNATEPNDAAWSNVVAVA